MLTDITPKDYMCLVKHVEFSLFGGSGILYKIGPDAFKDKRRFPDEKNILHEGMRVKFDARSDFIWIERKTFITENGLRGDGTILINDDRIFNGEDKIKNAERTD